MDKQLEARLNRFTNYCHTLLNSFGDVIHYQRQSALCNAAAMFFAGVVFGFNMGTTDRRLFWLAVTAFCLAASLFVLSIVRRRLYVALRRTNQIIKDGESVNRPPVWY